MPGFHLHPARSRRAFLKGLSAAVTLVGGGCSTLSTTQGLRVLTYNLHHGEGLDGRVDLPRIAGVIRATRPDVVAMQEMDRRTRRTGGVDQPAVLAELTGLFGEFGAAMPYQGGEYGQALLSRWPLLDFEVVRLPNPSKREPRIAVTACVEPIRGRRIRITGVHLDHVAADTDRWEQAGELIQELARKPSWPMVLAGDFNDLPNSRLMQRFHRAGWVDTAGASASPTVPAEAPKSRIDYILALPSAAWRVVDSEVLPESLASDHRPLRATLQLKGPG